MSQRTITVTYDETDLDEEALRAARRSALSALMARGVNDLNTVTVEQLDAMFAIFKIAYENNKAQRDHKFGSFRWSMEYRGHKQEEELP